MSEREPWKCSSRYSYFQGGASLHKLVSRKVTFTKQVWIPSFSLLLMIIKWLQSSCRKNADPGGLRGGGTDGSHSLWSPMKGDNFHLFSSSHVLPRLCLIPGASEWAGGTAGSLFSELGQWHPVALQRNFGNVLPIMTFKSTSYNLVTLMWFCDWPWVNVSNLLASVSLLENGEE